MKGDLVSIITPTYNSKKYIDKTLNSILDQEYHNWELIIVDDNSSDGTIEYINEKYKDDRIITIALSVNSGAAVTRNTGINIAKGRFIAFIDSDDMWQKNKLSNQINFMIKNDYAFTYTFFDRVNENVDYVSTSKAPAKIVYKDLLKNTAIGCSTVILDKSKIKDVSMPLIRKGQDTATWLKILKSGLVAHCLEESLTLYTIRRNSISSNKFLALKRTWNIYRNVENLSLVYSAYYFSFYFVNALKRRKLVKE